MEFTQKKLLIVGSTAEWSLEMSYLRAAKLLGFDIQHFDPQAGLNKYIKGSILGRKIHTFLPVEAWDRKMNRDLIIKVKSYSPDLILLFGPAKILYGTLATIKIVSNASIAWVWPDTPMNLTSYNLQSGQLFDLSATYSEASVPVFQKIQFNNVHWVPLAGDTELHRVDIDDSQAFECDISFVGMWRPERERVMTYIEKNFPQLNLVLYGKYWQRDCSNKALLKKWKGEVLIGKDVARFFSKSRININVIDDTNYPAANMRFFEICTAGGLQVTSACPEMENKFRDRQELLYFNDEQQLLNQLEWVLENPGACKTIRQSGQLLIDNDHSYVNRLQQILNLTLKNT